jgi:hypothetical protein
MLLYDLILANSYNQTNFTLLVRKLLCITVRLVLDAVNTAACAPDDGQRHYPKHVEQPAAINKLHIVASRWIINWLRFAIHGNMNVKETETS